MKNISRVDETKLLEDLATKLANERFAGSQNSATTRELMSTYVLGTSAATSSGSGATLYDDVYNHARSTEWEVFQLKQDVSDINKELAGISEQVTKLEVGYSDAIGEALKQVGMADYKDRVQKEFNAIVEKRLNETKTSIDQKLNETKDVIEATYKSFNEKFNALERSAMKRLNDLEQVSKKYHLEVDKINFLAKELGYQMDIADKSF